MSSTPVLPTLPAIPTTYNGVKFKSRLEARFAVFFDQMGVRWEYEPEGYRLPSQWYAPDFWLPDPQGRGRGVWVEVKPDRWPLDVELQKMRELCDASECVGFLLAGLNGRRPWLFRPGVEPCRDDLGAFDHEVLLPRMTLRSEGWFKFLAGYYGDEEVEEARNKPATGNELLELMRDAKRFAQDMQFDHRAPTRIA